MIGHLRGTLLERAGNTVVVECAGVGYQVALSAHSLAELGPDGAPVALRIYTHFVQNGITLYGFTGAVERQLFDLLITVKNVGPASAVKILSSGAGPVDLARLIAAGQTSALNALRGVARRPPSSWWSSCATAARSCSSPGARRRAGARTRRRRRPPGCAPR